MEQEAQLLMVGKNDDKGKFMEPAKNENFMMPWKTVRVKESYPSNVHRALRCGQSPFSGTSKVWNLSISTRNLFPSVNNILFDWHAAGQVIKNVVVQIILFLLGQLLLL